MRRESLDRILRDFTLLRDRVADWSQYPFNIPAIANLKSIHFHPGITFFVGENGSGKSTLIEAIAVKAGFNPEGGTKNFKSSYRPSESRLHEYVRLARGSRRESSGFFLRAETMFNVSTEAEQYRDYGWDDLHEMSHGEAFLWVANNRFRERGLYILDEPEAALSPQRQLSLLVVIRRLIRSGSQFIVSTHSPILLAYPDSRIFSLDRTGMAEVKYEDTEHYAVTKAFLMNPQRMLDRIFADDDAAGAD
ncbi:MAG TPA: AAA family ATPase [Polyangiaceae bacterium]|nr:AAA family ATPase [Polyangiaceae bacterium]